MRTILFTGYNEPYTELAEITVPRMRKFARMRGWDFKVFYNPTHFPVTRDHVYWTGCCGAIEAFQNRYNRAVYLDVDQVVTNFDFNSFPMAEGFHVSRDWGDDAMDDRFFSMCGFIASKEAEPIFRASLMLAEAWKNKGFPEQNVIRHISEMGIHGSATVHRRRLFNCVPSAVCEGRVQEPWQQGDFCAHLTMLSLPERIKMAQTFV